MAEVAAAWVSLAPSARGFGKKLDAEVGPQLDKSGKSASKRLGSSIGSGLKSALTPALAILGTAGVGSFLKGSIDEAREAQKVGALTNAVIKSTGGIANVTAKDVDKLASSLSAKIGVDDEAIAAGQNMLLTFGRVRNEVGKGNDIFNQATVAANDMAAAFGGDAVSNSKMLGRALNDPTKGVSALTRVGVSFTSQQKEQIKTLQASGDILGAQKIILGEVAKQTEGAAAATATSGEKMSVAFGNLQETVGTALIPVIDKFNKKLTSDIIPAVSSFVTGMQDGTGAGGQVASTLRDIYNAGKPIVTVLAAIVQGFAGLPGGTQKVILLAGAVALLSNRFSGSLPSLQNFDRTAALATAKTVALRGGALAAGAGLAALTTKAGGTSTSLGALTTIGAGVATGFAVGGPWGAALGGAAGLLSVFTGRSNAAAASQARFKANAASVVATLNQETGALTGATRAATAKALADDDAFSAARKMGISYNDVLAATLGNEAATKRVQKATETYLTTQNTSIKSLGAASEHVDTLRRAMGTTSSEIARFKRNTDQANSALGKLDKAKANPSVQITGLTTALASIAVLNAAIDHAARRSAKLKIGANAKGTDNWRGGLTMVGEKGPELINLAKGAQVIPNHKLGDVGSQSKSGSVGAGDSAMVALLERIAVAAEAGSSVQIDGREFARQVKRAEQMGRRL
ncbi:hypothetical protein [Aeromicrobium stalagmiti]|uniref:hypothetical protein n=1 Tax=Aeromicrobium stalagmiti TaxID=2738988 RepID=UPI0015682D72|nr:hypothetical protein [Aeromicrobium stalagmiti]NRQ51560.1 hypothetical protein [Aeromicrobium stalagmiti]